MNPKKQQIIDAALKLFVNKGFSKTSIQDIINEANIAKGTFYNYFVSKNECLMAILEFVEEKGDQRRQELEYGKKKTDEKVFIDQVAVRMNMNKEYNLLHLFETVTFSSDKDLIEFMKKQHTKEIKWIGNRIYELFQLEKQDYIVDHAVIFLGMLHHIMHFWKINSDRDIPIEQPIQFVLNRLKPMVYEQIESGELFFKKDWILLEIDASDSADIEEQFIDTLKKLKEKLSREKQDVSKELEYIEFILQEMKSAEPKEFVLESILLSLAQTLKDSNYEHDVRRIMHLAEVLKNN
ncbi:TetR/AcrR family transcriptional regulator [Ornithinibacillus halophilus]|uniref:Transcriptional regulator, TetR family n=1 Tax=Ornithinibacillus halophilus TaxID=930117 RepID=A0A1M5HRE5_9BACI|nr:TetR/AcrR family transcriptional regulator [Ornithinibacillus halophilus]SHG18534.1 transcriptional regulator, TetR family [Ornithinibacillus halophilus]